MPGASERLGGLFKEAWNGRMEFGVVARYFPSKKAGLIQVSTDDVVFFSAKDAHYLKLDTTHNRIVFAKRQHLVPKIGELVVFERHRYYSAVPGLVQARMWGSYVTWVTLHGIQIINLKRLVRSRPRHDGAMKERAAGWL